MKAKSFKDLGIELPRGAQKNGSVKTLCPKCSHTRINKPDDACLSISFDKTDVQSGKTCHLFNCHHCKFNGAIFPDGIPDTSEKYDFVKPKMEYKRPQVDPNDFDLEPDTLEWFQSRGINQETVEACGIKSCEYPFIKNSPEPAMMFPFYKNGELINIQYRNFGDKKNKRYRSVTGAQLIYFGFDRVVMDGFVATDTLYITEGPLDAMTLIQSGYPFVWSVPNGSPFEEEGKPPVKAPVLQYQDDPDAQYVLSQVKKVVFVGDNDHQGRRLVQELATRSGIEKCYKVQMPQDCKDINEVLTKYGTNKVIETVESAQRFPVDGVVRVGQMADNLFTLYDNGVDNGLSTGYDNLDEIFRLGTGKLVVFTGIPESGKSRFVSNIARNAARLHGAKFSMFTPESRPFANYIAKLVQIHTGKPFGQPGDKDRMSRAEVIEALKFLDEHFTFNAPVERTLEVLTSAWKQQMMAEGTRFAVLDPFNYIFRPPNMDEGTFVLKSLTFLADWCVTNGFTVFVVVHPTKIMKNQRTGEYPVVTPYNIYGSSHWFNCADFILSIWRSHKENLPVQVHVLKAKQEELGTSNKMCLFKYDVKTGVYAPHYGDADEVLESDMPEEEEEGYRGAAQLSTERTAFDDDEAAPVRSTRKTPRPRQRGATLNV